MKEDKISEILAGYFNQSFFDKPIWDKVVEKLTLLIKEEVAEARKAGYDQAVADSVEHKN